MSQVRLSCDRSLSHIFDPSLFVPALQWDPMITTLPGLYLLSVGVVKPAAWLFGWTGAIVCSTGMLRFINLLFSAGNFYLLYLLLLKIHQKNKVQSTSDTFVH